MSTVEVSDIQQTVGFRVPIPVIMEALTSSSMMSGYTQSPCKVDAKVGGEFSLFNGGVTGKYQQVVRREKRRGKEKRSKVRFRMKQSSKLI